jgi:hypothetical protein
MATSILCEGCGYPLDGHAADSLCPECALPVRESLSERRIGTPWQQAPSVRSLVSTAFATVLHPGATYHILRLRTDGTTRGLLGLYLSMAVLAPLAMWVTLGRSSGGTVTFWYMRPTQGTMGVASITSDFLVPQTWIQIALGVPLLTGTLLLLTWIETLGVRFFGRRRGWRITGPIAWSVCSHATIGWAIGGVLHALSPLLVRASRPLLDLLAPATAVRVASELAMWTPVVAFFIGMLIFEALVYVGVRACRYASEPRAD